MPQKNSLFTDINHVFNTLIIILIKVYHFLKIKDSKTLKF